MKYNKFRVVKVILFSILTIYIFASCKEDENIGEFKLTGNIENLIPENSCDIKYSITKVGNGTNYLVVAPELISEYNFEYWGLRLKKVEYYIDGNPFKTVNAAPFELVCPVSEIGIGNHTLMAKIVVGGEYCDDVVLEKSDGFKISSTGTVSQATAEFYFDYNCVCKGETFRITPYILEEKSPEGSRITKVDYYWDGSLTKTITESPFTWEYQVNDEADTEHKIAVHIEYSDNNNVSKSFSWSFGNYTIMNDDDCAFWWQTKSADKVFRNGETVQSVAKFYKGKNCKDAGTFKLYYDGNIIGESGTFPYEIDYKLANQSTGSHTFKTEWTIKNADGEKWTLSQNETITIVP